MPDVSVIIPTRERLDFLRVALRSVLDQTFSNLEAIVVDDGSVTDIRPTLRAFDDGRIRYFRHELNRGEAGARNTGILNARGDYLAFLDDDDEWRPDKLQLQLDLFTRSSRDVGCVYGGYEAVRAADGRVLYDRRPSWRGDLSSALMRKNVVGPPSTVVLTRECIERVGLCDESIAYGVDYDLWIRVAQRYRFECVDDVVVRYSLHDGQLTKDAVRVVKGHEELARKYGAPFNPDRREVASAYFNLGMLRCGEGDRARARRALWQTIRLDPRNPRRYVFFAVSLVSPARASFLGARIAGARIAGAQRSPLPER
jgi:glycosyltransferase involved in cell wall biosynthesis